MKVLVLAGGEGSRLAPFTSILPKALFPISGRPVSRIIIERLISFDLEDIILCINREYEKLFRHAFRDLDIQYSVSPSPQGSAGEVYYARQFIDDDFLVVYSDDLTEIEYDAFIKFHNEHKSDVSLHITKELLLDVGVVVTNKEGKLLSFKEKPPINVPIWTGTAIFKKEFIYYFKPNKDIARDVFPALLKHGRKVYCYETDSLWLDIGSISHYRRAKKIFEGEKWLKKH
ncbi:MAG: nucleotidyltransferase family protein [Methanophagales archaeon]|nr:nucleotidyltransferase family protein [Methanophagales archaeon]